MIKHCEQEAIETAEALKKAKGLILAKLAADQDAISDRYAKLTAECKKLIAQVQGTEQFTDKALERALQFQVDVIEGLESPTFDDKRLYLELLQVTVKAGHAIIWCALPVDVVEVDLAGRD